MCIEIRRKEFWERQFLISFVHMFRMSLVKRNNVDFSFSSRRNCGSAFDLSNSARNEN
jgi:hypothetical protein